MAKYANGRIPLNELVREGDNYFFPGTYRRWKNLVSRVKKEYGVTLFISPPSHGASNAYRPLGEQILVRNALGILASVPGYSSHGGVWSGQTTGRYGLPRYVSNRETGALDVNNWMDIGWENFKKAAEAEGFWVDVTVPQEKWHIVDPNPWTVPASGGGGGGSEEEMNKEQERKLDQLISAFSYVDKRTMRMESKMDSSMAEVSSILGKVIWLAEQRVKGSGSGPSITAMLNAILSAVESVASSQGIKVSSLSGEVEGSDFEDQ